MQWYADIGPPGVVMNMSALPVPTLSQVSPNINGARQQSVNT